MKRKKAKLKWKNLFKLLLFITLIMIILHDFYIISINSWITGKQATMTVFGLLTGAVNCFVAAVLYEDLEEELRKNSKKKTTPYRN